MIIHAKTLGFFRENPGLRNAWFLITIYVSSQRKRACADRKVSLAQNIKWSYVYGKSHACPEQMG